MPHTDVLLARAEAALARFLEISHTCGSTMALNQKLRETVAARTQELRTVRRTLRQAQHLSTEAIEELLTEAIEEALRILARHNGIHLLYSDFAALECLREAYRLGSPLYMREMREQVGTILQRMRIADQTGVYPTHTVIPAEY